jgi:predicted nucleic acid-binding protein
VSEPWAEPIYLDTSALVKLLVPEEGSDALNARLLGSVNVVISDLAVTECASALGRRLREGRISAKDARRLQREAVRLQSVAHAAELTPPTHRRAEQLLLTLTGPLRTLDALHLAAALEAGAATLVTFDSRLSNAALAVGLATSYSR